MALNRQTFQTRALTAIIFAVVMMAGLLWNPWSFFILFSIIHFGCWWEYLKLTEKIYKTSLPVNAKLGMMLMGYGFMLWFCDRIVYQVNGYSLKDNISLPVSGAGFILLLMGIFQKGAINIKAFGFGLLGLIYISLSWGLLIDLAGIIDSYFNGNGLFFSGPFNIFFVLVPVVIIASLWINDTMAYIVGSFIGKTPLTSISPKKTWEGTVGGIILAVVVTGFLAKIFIPTQYHVPGSVLEIPYYHWFIIAAIAAISGTFGDLLESKLKRMAGVKDSGTLMPGHGGFLDRFDSLLLATPFVWIYVQLCMR